MDLQVLMGTSGKAEGRAKLDRAKAARMQRIREQRQQQQIPKDSTNIL